MRPLLRPTLVPPPFPAAVLAAVLALAAGLVAGCGGDDAPDAGPTVVATGPHDSSAPTGGATRAARTTASATSTPSEEPSGDPAVCAPYAVMVAAIEDAALTTTDPEEVAAAIAPVMKRFAAQVARLPQPSGMSDATWAGVVALADRIRALPAHPSNADIEAVERELTSDQRAAVEDAADWFKATCGH